MIKKQSEKIKPQQQDDEEIIVYQAPIPEKIKKKIEKQTNVQFPINLEDLLFGKIKKPQSSPQEPFDEVKRKPVVLEKPITDTKKSDLSATEKEIKKQELFKVLDTSLPNKFEEILENKDDLKKMIIFAEIIAPPLCLRPDNNKLYDIM